MAAFLVQPSEQARTLVRAIAKAAYDVRTECCKCMNKTAMVVCPACEADKYNKSAMCAACYEAYFDMKPAIQNCILCDKALGSLTTVSEMSHAFAVGVYLPYVTGIFLTAALNKAIQADELGGRALEDVKMIKARTDAMRAAIAAAAAAGGGAAAAGRARPREVDTFENRGLTAVQIAELFEKDKQFGGIHLKKYTIPAELRDTLEGALTPAILAGTPSPVLMLISTEWEISDEDREAARRGTELFRWSVSVNFVEFDEDGDENNHIEVDVSDSLHPTQGWYATLTDDDRRVALIHVLCAVYDKYRVEEEETILFVDSRMRREIARLFPETVAEAAAGAAPAATGAAAAMRARKAMPLTPLATLVYPRLVPTPEELDGCQEAREASMCQWCVSHRQPRKSLRRIGSAFCTQHRIRGDPEYAALDRAKKGKFMCSANLKSDPTRRCTNAAGPNGLCGVHSRGAKGKAAAGAAAAPAARGRPAPLEEDNGEEENGIEELDDVETMSVSSGSSARSRASAASAVSAVSTVSVASGVPSRGSAGSSSSSSSSSDFDGGSVGGSSSSSGGTAVKTARKPVARGSGGAGGSRGAAASAAVAPLPAGRVPALAKVPKAAKPAASAASAASAAGAAAAAPPGEKKMTLAEKRTVGQITLNCQAPNCRGFLNKQFLCRVCAAAHCETCWTLIPTSTPAKKHVCAVADIESVKRIKSECKSCPKCQTITSKVSGCNHMFCLNCETCFDWATMQITKTSTSPDYHDWLSKNGRGATFAVADLPPMAAVQDMCTARDFVGALYIWVGEVVNVGAALAALIRKTYPEEGGAGGAGGNGGAAEESDEEAVPSDEQIAHDLQARLNRENGLPLEEEFEGPLYGELPEGAAVVAQNRGRGRAPARGGRGRGGRAPRGGRGAHDGPRAATVPGIVTQKMVLEANSKWLFGLITTEEFEALLSKRGHIESALKEYLMNFISVTAVARRIILRLGVASGWTPQRPDDVAAVAGFGAPQSRAFFSAGAFIRGAPLVPAPAALVGGATAPAGVPAAPAAPAAAPAASASSVGPSSSSSSSSAKPSFPQRDKKIGDLEPEIQDLVRFFDLYRKGMRFELKLPMFGMNINNFRNSHRDHTIRIHQFME